MILLISFFAAFKSKPISPHCFVLPAQTKLLLQDIEGGGSQSYTLKSLESITTPFQNWAHSANSTREKMYIFICCFKSNLFDEFYCWSNANRLPVKVKSCIFPKNFVNTCVIVFFNVIYAKSKSSQLS